VSDRDEYLFLMGRHCHFEHNGAAANLAVFNVCLVRNGSVQQYSDAFPTIRAQHQFLTQIVHDTIFQPTALFKIKVIQLKNIE
jgi:hypothetical protein